MEFFSKWIGGKRKLHWESIEYSCKTQIVNNNLVNKMVNRLWNEKFKDIKDIENKYLIIMIRARLENSEIKSLCKLQKLRFSSKEFLKEFFKFKVLLIHDAYSDMPVKSIIFSWGIREFKYLKNDFVDTIVEATKPVEIKTHLHNYKTIKNLPLATDLSKYGKLIDDYPNFKVIDIGKKRILNINIRNENGFEFRDVSLIKDNKKRLTWIDKILNFEDNSLIRTIGNTLISLDQGKYYYTRTIIPTQKIQKIKTHKNLNNNIIAADIETYINKDNKMVPYLASFISSNKSYDIFNSSSQANILFMNFFNNIFTRVNKGYKIYFHNLSGFDSIFFLKYLINNKDYEIEPLIHNGKLISIEITYGKYTFAIRDSNLLLLQNLNKLAKSFNLEIGKGIFPYFLSDINYKGAYPSYNLFNTNKVTEKEWLEESNKYANKVWDFRKESINYCKNDSEVLLQVLNKFNGLIYNKFKLNINKYPTTPSLSFGIFRAHYMKENEIGILKGLVQKNIQLGYTGGSTDMFIPQFNMEDYDPNKKLYAYDVNSLYPFVMANNPYPIGNPSYIDYSEPIELTEATDIFGMFYVKVTSPTDPENFVSPILQIKYKTNGGYRTISPLGIFSGWFFSEELKNSLKYGYKIKVIRGYSFEKAYIFKDFVENLYTLRISYPKTDPMNYICKILLNSLYGRFGMKELSWGTEIVSKNDFLKFTESEKTDILDYVDFGKNILVSYKPFSTLSEDLNNNSIFLSNTNIAIASAVTAYARIHMSQFKNNPDLPNLYYTDTDSLYFDGPLPDHLVSSTRLGALKLEGVWDKAIFLAPKVYALENFNGEKLIKIKGLKKEVLNDISLEQLRPLLNEGEVLTFNQTKWFKSLSEANIKILETIYSLKVTSNKRDLIYKDGKVVDTKPIRVFL